MRTTTTYLAAAVALLVQNSLSLPTAAATPIPMPIIKVGCHLTAPGIAICGTIGLALHELIKGKTNNNGEIAKVLHKGLGINVEHISKCGLAGCKGSEVRKLGRRIAKVFGW